ncbi:tRNA preQ1(34) S-adenosylmethionine ribosyltransferase-isomerase QueA [Roseibium polysiphoniae]|uniref:S-adenosylmethionine:tRNA ribosyltransferase-isomerase n=1 Tax=Roseibium polysiphoniae TaxID=2571221 RepID=A0ABR9CAT7_9HYPH|nr:tRNA preQ1(34) S-adenosylmethionine ribosyltransferase-isomerase QueA [Roseibium polysiphoniae]MBD8876006.1 tRNA preQ1(34) S-adenosylmethionine ribosyltransferase-isomerase QueA [Roseibium polysiphoniae]
MRVDLFDFELPNERIALRPARPRDSARMLVVKPGGSPELTDAGVADLASYLEPGDALVFNDTKVIPAQLEGTRTRGDAVAKISATLHLRAGQDRWWAFVRPAKKLVIGDRVRFGGDNETCLSGTLDATVSDKGDAGEVLLVFDLSGPALDDAIVAVGHIPLPPYIAQKRGEDGQDKSDYQTIFAERAGAVAAPTAGLHFTPALLKSLEDRGIEQHRVTLHVGAGTFLPVKTEETETHKMHAEWGEVSVETVAALKAVKARGNKVVSVGTTSLRILESASQGPDGLQPFSGETSIFITPGYRFRTIDALMTNFHLPRSTLFMLVSAFAGLDTMQRAYAHAIETNYRFYSYGDGSLLFPALAGDER